MPYISLIYSGVNKSQKHYQVKYCVGFQHLGLHFFPCSGSEEALREIARSLETQQSASQHQKLLMAGILLPTQHTAVKSHGKKLPSVGRKQLGEPICNFLQESREPLN